MSTTNSSIGSSTAPSLYYYKPSVPMSIISVIGFLLVIVLYLWLFVRYRAWHFWAMYIGLIMEIVGFIFRFISVRDTTNVDAFVVSYLALLLAPSFMAAACYATFGRLLWWITPLDGHNFRTLWCCPRLVTPFFICFDLGSFFIQLLGAGAVGAAYTTKTLPVVDRQDKIRTGLGILRCGFALQLICFSIFVVVGIRFLWVSLRWAGRPLRYQAPLGANWIRLNWAVNLATIAITVRAIYRMIEFSSPTDAPSYLVRKEWPFWAFDALPIFGVVILFTVIYPGRHLPREFLVWWLPTRQLRNKAQSSPPEYTISIGEYSSEPNRRAFY